MVIAGSVWPSNFITVAKLEAHSGAEHLRTVGMSHLVRDDLAVGQLQVIGLAASDTIAITQTAGSCAAADVMIFLKLMAVRKDTVAPPGLLCRASPNACV